VLFRSDEKARHTIEIRKAATGAVAIVAHGAAAVITRGAVSGNRVFVVQTKENLLQEDEGIVRPIQGLCRPQSDGRHELGYCEFES
jgi:hypothetical protein